MLNIRILAKAVLQIFCSQGCSYAKCLSLKKGNKPTENFGISSKVNYYMYTSVCNYMPNIRILTKAVLQIFCSQVSSYIICLCPRKGSNSTTNLRTRLKINQIIYTLVCNYMPNIRILTKEVPQLFCSHGYSYTKCLCRKKESNSITNFWSRFKS